MRPHTPVGVFLKYVATLGPVGYLPVAPGTWGSAAGLILVELLVLPSAVYAAIIAGVVVMGIVASDVAERVIGEKDSGHIVIDELAGYLVTSYAVPHTHAYLIAAFLLFRIFDILKPFPIDRLEKGLAGGLGIMADDIMAGVFANILLQIWIRIS